MADKPKPPSIKAPKVVPGKETARRIGVDTAFIDGLAAGLMDDAPRPEEAESSGPLFKTDDVAKQKKNEAKDDTDPLAALLPDLPPEGEAKLPPPSPLLAPKRKDDLLSALAKDSDDTDLEVTVPEKKPLPKGDLAPTFEPEPRKDAKGKAKQAPATKEKAKPEPAAKKPKKAPAAAVVTDDEPEGNVHPGMWLIAAACLFGAAMPILMGSSPPPETPAAQPEAGVTAPAAFDAKRRPGFMPHKFAPRKGGKFEFKGKKAGFHHAGDAKSAADAEVTEEEEDVVEVEVDESENEVADDADAKSARKGQAGKGKDEPEADKTASQLLTEAKAAYSKGRASEAYKLASESNRKRQSADALTVKAKAACKMGNEGAAKKSFEALPMGAARREVRPVCRDNGIRLGL